nr:hypothetical protein [Tanacetum cinerariifolium]
MESIVNNAFVSLVGKVLTLDCPPKVLIISNPEPCNQTINNELPQTLPSFDSTCYSKKENSVPCISKPCFLDESSKIFNPPPQLPIYSCEYCGSNAQSGHYWTPQVPFICPELGYSQDFNFSQDIHDFQQQYPCCDQCGGPHEILQCQQNRTAFYDDDDNDDDVDYTIAITPVLSTEKPIDFLSMGDEHLDTIPATGSDEVIKSSVEDLVPIPSESEGIPEHMCDVPFHDNSLPLDASPPDSELVSSEVMEIVIPKIGRIDDDILLTIKDDILYQSSSTSFNSLLEETNTFHNSLPEFENFYFDLGEISSGSTTTHFDISLLDYEAFYINDDHVKEISSGSPTTQSDIFLSEYDSFIFDLYPPSDRCDFYEFTDELSHIISPPKYDCFYFRNLPDPGELLSIFNSRIRKNPSATTRVNSLVEDDHSSLLAYVVWIFLAYLTYPIIPPYLHLFGNKETIFDPGITINHFYSFKPSLSHRYGAFKKFNTHHSHLNEWPMIINGKNIPILDVFLFHFYPP